MGIYLIIFFGGGFFGFAIDTTYRSLLAGRYLSGTWLPLFSITYALAAVMEWLIFSQLAGHWQWQIVVATLTAILWELSAGLLSGFILHQRFWNYSNSFLNFRGLIDLQHSFYWLILTIVYRGVFYWIKGW